MDYPISFAHVLKYVDFLKERMKTYICEMENSSHIS